MIHRWSPRQRASAVALGLALIIAACSGDNILAPPDGADCTVGTIAPGDSVHGVVSGASCQAFDYDDYVVTYVASWTLSMQKDRAYVVRMYHDSTAADGDRFNGYLQAYGRGAHGEPTMITSQWSSFGANNGNGGFNREMFLVGDRDREVSIRVGAAVPADTGAYSLVVESCPVTVLSDTLAHGGIDLTLGCLSRSFDVNPVRRTFMLFPSDSLTPTEVDMTRTAGTGLFSSTLAGPVPDVNCNGDNCWNGDNSSTSHGADSTATLVTHFNLPGRVAASAVIDAEFAAFISVTAHFTAPAAVARKEP